MDILYKLNSLKKDSIYVLEVIKYDYLMIELHHLCREYEEIRFQIYLLGHIVCSSCSTILVNDTDQ